MKPVNLTVETEGNLILYNKLLRWLESKFGRVRYEGKTIAIDFDSLTEYSDFFRYGKGFERLKLRGIDSDGNKYEVVVVLDNKKAKWKLEKVKKL